MSEVSRDRAGQVWMKLDADGSERVVSTILFLSSMGVMHGSSAGYVMWDHDVFVTFSDDRWIFKTATECETPYEDMETFVRLR